MNVKVILFGATGMVGEGVLHESLKSSEVGSVLVVGRRSCGVQDQKLTEIVLTDLFDLSGVEDRLSGYTACFFCLGVSSIGMRQPDYERITYELTMHIATILARHNPAMTFCYISGAGTDSTESGRSMWARVKGKTENHLMKLPFKAVFNFRPGYIKPIKGLHHAYHGAAVVGLFYPILKTLFRRYVCTLEELGRAMIYAASKGYSRNILECGDIVPLGSGG